MSVLGTAYAAKNIIQTGFSAFNGRKRGTGNISVHTYKENSMTPHGAYGVLRFNFRFHLGRASCLPKIREIRVARGPSWGEKTGGGRPAVCLAA